MPSTDPVPGVGDRESQRTRLLAVAAQSIMQGLSWARPLVPDLADYPLTLQAQRATFVTLKRADMLRGCIGVLEPKRSLVDDIAQNAYRAAFEDPRFAPLERHELCELTIEISVLSLPERLQAASEADLIAQLRPGVDGLILEDQGQRATFLPAVWSQLPDPKIFLSQLRRKARLPENAWSPSLRVSRYTTETFGAAFAAIPEQAVTRALAQPLAAVDVPRP
ncbi:AmmeMemoRadiSam system protein A [Thiocapsa imhoffii]|nr:AmmeMemoRadiSam system protein A [Thiocapsa imhoffii]